MWGKGREPAAEAVPDRRAARGDPEGSQGEKKFI
jgi:hypothetical protein